MRPSAAYDAPMLDRLVAAARKRAGAITSSIDTMRQSVADAPAARDFGAGLVGPGLSVIAEVKRRSPSVGSIDVALDPGPLAAAYQAGGAAAVSVLTEPEHFGAEPGDLAAARAATSLPVLRKDFIVDAAQVWEARLMGADAVLLIAAMLGDGALSRLIAETREAGMAALVEAHTEREVRDAVAAGADIIGVNNRDLGSFEVDLATSERLRPLIPAGVVAVSESGVSSPQAAARMAAAGFDAVLVGEAAVRAADPASFVAALRMSA